MRLNWQRFLNIMSYISKFLSAAVALTTVFFISNSYGQNSPPPRASSPPPLESSSPQVKAKDKISIGTGFFITDNGYLITSNHVINKFSSIFVIFPDSRKLPAKLIRFDEVNDLALLKVDAITSFLYLSHSQGVPAGMEVVTIGYPHVGIQGFAPKITQGIVNSPSGLKDDKNSFIYTTIDTLDPEKYLLVYKQVAKWKEVSNLYYIKLEDSNWISEDFLAKDENKKNVKTSILKPNFTFFTYSKDKFEKSKIQDFAIILNHFDKPTKQPARSKLRGYDKFIYF